MSLEYSEGKIMAQESNHPKYSYYLLHLDQQREKNKNYCNNS
jgi:hypothetical protein